MALSLRKPFCWAVWGSVGDGVRRLAAKLINAAAGSTSRRLPGLTPGLPGSIFVEPGVMFSPFSRDDLVAASPPLSRLKAANCRSSNRWGHV